MSLATLSRPTLFFSSVFVVFGFLGAASGDEIVSLGNTASGFTNGSMQTVPAVGAAQGGQPAPFNGPIGTDGLFGGDFTASWTFLYAPTDPVTAALIEIGIFDHDSVAAGSQVAAFSVEGTDLTVPMNALFEGDPGDDLGFNIYSLDITALLPDLSVLADGSTTVSLTLQGPHRITPLFPLPGPNPPQDAAGTNGANLIYSTLSLTTQPNNQPPTDVVPEPTSVAIWSILGLLGFVVALRRRRRYAVV